MIPIYVNPSSGVPIYMQVVNQVRSLIASGVLKEGEKLPSVRGLAKFLQVNPMTVSKAYSALEREKTVYRLSGKGVYVSSSPDILKKKERLTMLENHIRDLVYEAIRLNIPPGKAVGMVEKIFKGMQRGEK